MTCQLSREQLDELKSELRRAGGHLGEALGDLDRAYKVVLDNTNIEGLRRYHLLLMARDKLKEATGDAEALLDSLIEGDITGVPDLPEDMKPPMFWDLSNVTLSSEVEKISEQ